MKVKVYVCPTPGCGNYYGSSSMGDLNIPAPPRTEDRVAIAKENNGQPYRHLRSQCPDCRARGESVERVLCEFDGVDVAEFPGAAVPA